MARRSDSQGVPPVRTRLSDLRLVHRPGAVAGSCGRRRPVGLGLVRAAPGSGKDRRSGLTEDVWVTMPPVPLQYQGRELAARFHTAVTFRRGGTCHLVPTRANGQLAFGAYLRDAGGVPLPALGLLVFTLSGNRICAITRFDNTGLPRFGLPGSLPG